MSTTAVTWIYPSGNVTSETGSSLDISLNPLRVSDAGQYTCNVSVSSPFLTGAQSSTDMFTINVQGKSYFMCYIFDSSIYKRSVIHIFNPGCMILPMLCLTTGFVDIETWRLNY